MRRTSATPLRWAAAAALAAALVCGCGSPPPSAGKPLAVGVPLGPESEEWADLRDVPFEIHLEEPNGDGPLPGCIEIPLEIRPGGNVIVDFDGTRAMPYGLFRKETRNYNDITATLGSGATTRVISPYGGWEAALPLDLAPAPGESALREITLDVDFLRLLEWKDTEVTLPTGGILDPVPRPLYGDMQATPRGIVLTSDERRDGIVRVLARSREFSRNPESDLWQGKDARGRRIHWSGSSQFAMHEFSEFTVYGSMDEPIAYPVSMRFREPIRWTRRTYRFVLRDVPIPR